MKKNRIAFAAVLCTMMIAPMSVNAQDFSDFESLKQDIESASEQSEFTFSTDVKFNGGKESETYDQLGITIGNDGGSSNKDITIRGGKKEEGTYALVGNQGGEPESKKWFDTAFDIKSGSKLKLENLTIKDFGSKNTGGTISNSGELTIGSGVTFENNKNNGPSMGGRPYPLGSGVITNSGTLTLESSSEGNILFKTVSDATIVDIFMKQGGTLTIKGESGNVELQNGIASDNNKATITKENNNGFILGGDSSKYTGTYTQKAGTTTFKGSKYFGGNSDIKAGTFNWQASDDTTRGKLSFGANTILNVGDSSTSSSSVLTLDGSKGDTISDTITMMVNSGSTLNLNNFTTTLKKKINGTGTLSLTSDDITFEGNDAGLAGDVDNYLTLKTKDSTLTLSNMTNDTSTLTTIAHAVETGDNITNTIININNYNNSEDDKGMVKKSLTVDGKAITQLNFSGKNVYNQGSNCDITISVPKENDVAGVMTNKAGANTTIHGDLEIGKAEERHTHIPTLVNEAGATLTIDAGLNGLTNEGKVDNEGTLKATSIGNDGDFENSGTLEAETLINGQKSSSAVFNSTTDNFTVSNDVTNYTQITGKKASFGTYNGSSDSSDLDLSGDLTITGESSSKVPISNAIQNGGKIKAKNITVQKNGVTNNGTIETGNITLTSGDLINGSTGYKGTINADSINVTGKITNDVEGSSITAKGKITASGEVTNSGDLIQGSALEFGSLANNKGKIESTSDGITIGGTATNAGDITSAGALSVTGTLTNTGNITMAGGSLNDVTMNGGTVTNSGELSIGGAVTGSDGSIENSGNLTLTGDGSGFTGKFTQKDGSTTVTGKLFNGEKSIEKGSLTVTGEKMDWTNAVQLASDTQFNFTGSSSSKSTISDAVLKFTGTGAKANFNGTGGYSIADKFNGHGNNLTFTGTTVTLDGTDYSKAGTITLNNSNLNLHDADTAQYKDYVFEDFVSNGGSVDLDLQIVNENQKLNEGYLKSDTLTFNSGSGTLSVGKLYIDNKAQNGVDSYTTKDHVIKGEGNVNFDGSSVGSGNITWSSNSFVYDVQASGKDITLSNGRAASENALNDMNILAGERQFQTENEYSINKDLDATESGKFNVFGKSKNNQTDSLKGNGHRFFNIGKDKTTELHIDDLTISGASSSDGGSVLKNESANSKVFINKSDISGNTSTGGKGGAIYNNGGSGIDPKDESNFTGLYVGNTTFENNTATGEGAKGGAIYNDENGFLYLENVTTAKATGEGQNDIYNAGTTYTNGENTFNSLFTNDGNVTFQGQNTLSEFVNNATAIVNSGNAQIDSYSSTKGTLNLNSGTNATLGTVTGDVNSSITNNGNLTLTGYGAGYTGVFQQTAGSTTVNSDATFFGGTSTVSGGTLNWYTASQPEKSVLNVSGDETVLNVGDASHTGSITFGTGSSITEEVTTNIYDGSTLNVAGGNVTLSNGLWQGDVSLESGNLTLSNLNNITSGGTLKATEGNLTLTGTTKLALDEDSSIEEKVVTNIGKESEVYLNQGSLTLDSLDTWEGSVLMAGESTGKLTFDGYDDTTKGMGTLAAFGGEIDILNSSNITLGGDEPGIISENVKTVIDGNSSVTLLEEGLLVLNDDDTWQGTVNLTGGVLDYGVTDPNDVGILKAAKGNLNLLSGSVLNIESPSVVEKAVAVDIQQGATVEVLNGANFTIDSETGDKWHGLVKVKDGTFMTEGMSNRDGIGGKLQQESGSSIFDKGSDILISGTDSFVNGGDISVLNQSRLSFASGNDLTLDDLTVTKDSTFGIMNSLAQTVTATNQFVDDNSNFAMDLNLRNGPSDKFILENLKKADGSTSANVHVSDFGFVGGAPVYRNVDMQLFDVQNLDENVTFSATDKQIMTPIGEYGLTSLGGGKFRASLGRYNPKVFRGQASTLSMYNNQLAINDILLNHVILHSEKNEFGQGRTANRYAAVNPLFAPYQYTQKEGGLWFKSYVDIERLSMTHNLNVNNTAYGTIIGADLPLVNLENGWDFIPTFYIAYNGSNQNYSGVDMYQNGGQGGFMGTFMKNDFIGSVLAYGGGYFNEMNVEGFNDQTGNWFAGTAAKAAYNFHPTKHFIIQPNALISYNAFGKQNWGTDFGVMSMNAGMLNGINVAPGLNLIYGRESWSLYATFQYMYNINDHVGGHAGVDVDLPNLSMRHGYFQYGIGATKTWKDRLNSYFQFVIRNGGRTGVGFQLGLQYLFDWTNFGKHKKSSLPPKKTVLKQLGKK